MPPPTIILASTSPHRRALLERLGVAFSTAAPGVDEAACKSQGLSPRALAESLAAAKARAVARRHPGAIVIGSDQVCALADEVFGKPGDRPGAIAQLRRLRQRTHALITAVCVHCSGREHAFTNVSHLRMHALSDAELERYVDVDQPFDCAGAYKIERAGIALFDAIESADHTAITGLPLLQLCAALRQLGIALP
jgi:septum formation protein